MMYIRRRNGESCGMTLERAQQREKASYETYVYGYSDEI